MPSYADLSAERQQQHAHLFYTDTGANVKRLLQIIKSIDTQTSTVADVRVFQLKYANAASAAKLINEIFKVDTQQSQPAEQRRKFLRAHPPAADGRRRWRRRR